MKYLFLISLSILFLSCKDGNGSMDKGKKNGVVQDKIFKHESPKVVLKISAHLIYDDGTLSAFDVLNDKTIALWNVVAGGGDALKPSNKTKINLDGNTDSLNIIIKNGRRLVIDTTIIHLIKNVVFFIKNTGCSEVFIKILRNKTPVYNDTIPFHCGE